MAAVTTARHRLLVALVAVVAFCTLVGTPASAKKKGGGKKGGGAVDITKAVGQVIPDALPPPPNNLASIFGTLTSTIDVGKRFKGRVIRDVNVTVQTAGATGATPGNDLLIFLTAPSGADSRLFGPLDGFGPTTPSIGPLTFDDESVLDLGSGLPINSTQLYQPWVGTAAPAAPLAVMDGDAVRGTWTLTVQDGGVGETSNLVSWRLNVVAGKPFLTK